MRFIVILIKSLLKFFNSFFISYYGKNTKFITYLCISCEDFNAFNTELGTQHHITGVNFIVKGCYTYKV